MAKDLDLERKIQSFSDEKLVEMLKDASGYRAEAISYAQNELSRRGRLDVVNASIASARQQQEQKDSKNNAPVEIKYKSAGGWLLFFCIGLTILTPLITLFNLISGYNATNQFFDQFPGLVTITVIDWLFSIGLMIFSIYAGIALWKIRPGAVNIVKKYLLTVLGYTIIAAFLPFIAGLPARANDAMIAEVIKNIFRSIIYVFIWYSYLNKSKRVKATFNIIS